ncbi:MAG TPA: hypothetical protein DIU35_17985 [Candidatus Latescibacteria bacterium]|nr:hypothetical protein [Gemmatimonadota bacterium]HCR19371.1 hypothetical protein [Candidatus Latescibacterota bacterium]|tara:strand:- start:835 stop:1545 length:711 start_codon:yes stop_codon:yes gene_type:complete
MSKLAETRYVLLIGSVADGTADEFSDIDIQVVYRNEPLEKDIAACLGKISVCKFLHGEFHFGANHQIDDIPAGVMFTSRDRIAGLVEEYPDVSYEEYGELSRYIVNGKVLHGDKDAFATWRRKCERVPAAMKRGTIANVMGSLNFYFRGGNLLQLAERGDWIMVNRVLNESVMGMLRIVYLLNDRMMVKPKRTRIEMDGFQRKPRRISDRLEDLYLLRNTVSDVKTKVDQVIHLYR